MAKLTFFFLIIFLAVLSLLAFFNKESVSLTVWKGVTYHDIPVIALIFMSTAVGIVSMILITVVRDTRRRIESWQMQLKQKKEAKLLESYAKGLEAFYAARYDEAADLFTSVLEYEPENLNSLLRMGDIYFIEKQYTKSEEYYLKAREVKPKSIEVLLSLEKAAEAQEKWQEAVKHLDSILDIDGENRSILQRKREIHENNGRWEEVMDVQHKILKSRLSKEEEDDESKKLLGYKYEMGRSLLESGAADRAIKTLKSVVKADRNFIAAYITLADAYLKEGSDKEAQATLIKGYEETSSIVFLVRLEDHFIGKGEPGSIIEIYQKAVQKDRKDLRLQFFLAKLYYRLEMIDYALDTINGIDPSAVDSPDFHALVGSVYERRSEYEKAADEFKKALNVDEPLVIPYCCSHCNYTSQIWTGRCPECRNWNTFILDTNEICKIQKRQSSP